MFKEAPTFIYSWKKSDVINLAIVPHPEGSQASVRNNQRKPRWVSLSHPWLRHQLWRPSVMLWSSPMMRETDFPTSEELVSGV